MSNTTTETPNRENVGRTWFVKSKNGDRTETLRYEETTTMARAANDERIMYWVNKSQDCMLKGNFSSGKNLSLFAIQEAYYGPHFEGEFEQLRFVRWNAYSQRVVDAVRFIRYTVHIPCLILEARENYLDGLRVDAERNQHEYSKEGKALSDYLCDSALVFTNEWIEGLEQEVKFFWEKGIYGRGEGVSGLNERPRCIPDHTDWELPGATRTSP